MIFHARQRHALLLADGRPPLVPLPRAFQVPAMHHIATEDLNNKLDATMTKCAQELSTLLIEAEELALESVLAEVTDTLMDLTPNEEEFKAIVDYKNLNRGRVQRWRRAFGILPSRKFQWPPNYSAIFGPLQGPYGHSPHHKEESLTGSTRTGSTRSTRSTCFIAGAHQSPRGSSCYPGQPRAYS